MIRLGSPLSVFDRGRSYLNMAKVHSTLNKIRIGPLLDTIRVGPLLNMDQGDSSLFNFAVSVC
jgi:hypothetical protein